MDLECDGSEVVVRYGPFSEEKLIANAEDTRDTDVDEGISPPRFAVSVQADVCREGETLVDAVSRMTREIRLNGRTIAVMLGSALRKSGFELIPDPRDGMPMHYLVGEDPFQALPHAEVLASLVDRGRIPNPSR